ncbi:MULTISPECIES: polysaccharide deacetylase family protein [Actinomadura]|uniref:polysaccharide deacetylase family protein n=1 Tax=Actinomadura TaxID=1988 RepID=UPI0003AD6868|nr:polysaccharide deacetylase family protein [Actinomadura madurae]MCP9966241.1 polysaccharide deacetylase family protein [Actinomadura madurae]MCP9978735.1 polysaccharide deacetylase family protein [Actinomadura madurae]MCQ0009747.1 polysaccharide deacetylase family protein [Actinomadura madurae]
MDGLDRVRRGAAAVLAASLFGLLSTLTPAPKQAGLVAARSAAPDRHPAKPEPRPTAPPKPPPPDCARAKCVALTFDDGPAESTGELLDILAARHVRATFFLIGENVAEHPELVRREAAEGHELADHSYTHADLGHASRKEILSELNRTQDAIRRASGVTPVLLRPPYGSTSGRLKKITRSLGLAQVMWTVDPLDWERRDTGYVEKRVLKEVKPGSIVLLHDIHPTTVKAVPRIVDELAARGYVFVTVPELFGGRLTPGEEYVQLNSGEAQGLP